MREEAVMKRICIIHFVDVERYPPAMNLLRYLNKHAGNNTLIDVLTIRGESPAMTGLPRIRMHRLARWKESSTSFGRMLVYLQFNLRAVFKLIRLRPDVILYFETLSSGPAWFYKTFVRSKTSIYVHYHEYVSKTEYANGMLLSRWLHKKEEDLYPKMNWVSHTNSDRLSLFLRDEFDHQPRFTYVLPNYPPAAWREIKCSKSNATKIGFIYVGALSLETMYVREMAEFVKARPDECFWDIYSMNISKEVLDYFNGIEGNNITFKGAVSYDELPNVFCQYKIGLVLYKGHIPNYVYNVPNKLFEYHVCGLDVWFPLSMESTIAYQTMNTYPKIIAVNFSALNSINVATMTDRSGLREQRHDFKYEDAVKPLAETMLGEAS
jgi:hypothetical protein